MTDEIKLIKNNDNRQLSDLEWINEFYEFLRGQNRIRGGVKLSPKKAFQVIYYLQEHFPIFPDHIEQCSFCDTLFDSYRSGTHSEKTTKFYCDGCLWKAPNE